MITCFKGRVTVKGDTLDAITEYICITRTMFDILKSTPMTVQIAPDESLACELMSIITTAVADSKVSNRKQFYEVIETIAKHEKEKS